MLLCVRIGARCRFHGVALDALPALTGSLGPVRISVRNSSTLFQEVAEDGPGGDFVRQCSELQMFFSTSKGWILRLLTLTGSSAYFQLRL